MTNALALAVAALLPSFQDAHPSHASAATTAGAKPSLELAATIALPDVDGRIDHLAIDRRRNRLFVAALGNGSLEVVDLEKKQRLKSLKGLGEPQGVICLDEVGKVCVADGESGDLVVYDAVSLEKALTVRIGPDADNVRYEPLTRLVYVGFGGGALAIVDTKDWKVVGEIPLGGHPESFQLDAKGARMFVNVPSKRAIEVVDLGLRKVADTWPVHEAEQNFPMAVQGADRRLFVACRAPAKLLVLDPSNGRTFDALELSGDADDVFLDEASGKLFVSCGEGFLDVFSRGETGAYARAERIPTAVGARTCLFRPGDEKIYVAVPHRREQAAEIRVYSTRK